MEFKGGAHAHPVADPGYLDGFTGPLLAADDNPLKQELGKTRPLVVVELDAGNPTLATLKKQLEEAATKQSFEERSMVFYTVTRQHWRRREKFAKDPKDSKSSHRLKPTR